MKIKTIGVVKDIKRETGHTGPRLVIETIDNDILEIEISNAMAGTLANQLLDAIVSSECDYWYTMASGYEMIAKWK